MPARFVHLRNHTAYSLAEGAIRIGDMIKMCEDFSMPACAITDTNNMFGVPEFCKYAVEHGVKPIIGAQIAVDFGLPPETAPGGSSELVLLVQNEKGYRNLLKIVSKLYVGRDPKALSPVIPFADVENWSDGLIALSGGVDGPLGQCLLSGQDAFARENAALLARVFAGRFYIEIQRHGLPAEERSEDAMVALAYDLNLPLVATNECFFPTPDEYQSHDLFLCISGGNYVDEEERRRESPEHYFKPPAKMEELFADLPEAVENTVRIAERCSYRIKKSKPLLPKIAGSVGADEMLILSARQGLEERLVKSGIDGEARTPYLDRLAYEIGVITQMGFTDYFLIVADFIGWAKKNGIPVGPGRGSGAGSVVAWGLGITDLDPLRFDLLFERFLNSERVSMPDFDIDFCQDRRGEVIRYIQDKYGFDNVGQIITFGKLQSKNSIRDIGRVMRMSYTKCDELCKLVPNRIIDESGEPVKDPTLANLMRYAPDFREAVESNGQYKTLVALASHIEGLYRNAGMHAAGVVIADRPLSELVPLYKDADSDIPVASYNMKYIEDTGLIKYDFLGLKTLSLIKETLRLVEKNRGVKVDMDRIPLDDKRAFEMIASGNTAGIFQLESGGMKQSIFEMVPNRFEDLIALVALYRPGPMANIPSYCRRKHGAEPIDYIHPLMEPILRETYGIMVYQEQVMSMGKVLAGYTLAAADLLRRAMGKKIKSEMEKQRSVFIEGCARVNGIDSATAGQIFDLMEKFADYGFNKSHAACYAWIAYQTAYLKANFEPEFMAATMTYDMNDQEKLAFFAENLRADNIRILRPDINRSFEYFSVEDGSVRYALSGVKGVGVNIVKAIAAERESRGPFADMPDFMERMDKQFVNKKMLESLVFAGAFDSLEPNRAKLFANIEYILAQMNAIARDREARQASLFGDAGGSVRAGIKLANALPWKPSEALDHERDALGFYVSAHPLDAYEGTIAALRATPAQDARKQQNGARVTIAGLVESVNKRISKSGNTYWVATIADKTGSADVMFFERRDNSHKSAVEALSSDAPVAVSCDVRVNERGASLFGNSVSVLSSNVAVEGTLALSLSDADAVGAVKKLLEDIGGGYTTIELLVRDGGRLARVRLPDRYNITSENLVLFNSLGGVAAKVE